MPSWFTKMLAATCVHGWPWGHSVGIGGSREERLDIPQPPQQTNRNGGRVKYSEVLWQKSRIMYLGSDGNHEPARLPTLNTNTPPHQGLAHSGKGSLVCLLYQTALSFTHKCEKSAMDHKAFKDFKENQQHERGAKMNHNNNVWKKSRKRKWFKNCTSYLNT